MSAFSLRAVGLDIAGNQQQPLLKVAGKHPTQAATQALGTWAGEQEQQHRSELQRILQQRLLDMWKVNTLAPTAPTVERREADRIALRDFAPSKDPSKGRDMSPADLSMRKCCCCWACTASDLSWTLARQ